jgi:hypothetical protein
MCGAIPQSLISITHLNKRADVWSNPALTFSLCQLQGYTQFIQCILITHLNKRADVWSNPILTYILCQLQGHLSSYNAS